MGAFVRKDEVKRINLPDGEWIELKARFSYAEIKSWRDISAAGNESKAILRMITAWNILGEDGKVLEITAENLDCLDGAVIMLISNEVENAVRPLLPTNPA